MKDFFTILPRMIVLKAIRAYQKTISFDYGLPRVFFPHGYCRFHPTCSKYAYQAVEKYGIVKGILMGFWRVLRCNPFNQGGYDPVDRK